MASQRPQPPHTRVPLASNRLKPLAHSVGVIPRPKRVRPPVPQPPGSRSASASPTTARLSPNVSHKAPTHAVASAAGKDERPRRAPPRLPSSVVPSPTRARPRPPLPPKRAHAPNPSPTPPPRARPAPKPTPGAPAESPSASPSSSCNDDDTTTAAAAVAWPTPTATPTGTSAAVTVVAPSAFPGVRVKPSVAPDASTPGAAAFPGIRVKTADDAHVPSPATGAKAGEHGGDNDDGDPRSGSGDDQATFPGIRVKHMDTSVTVVPPARASPPSSPSMGEGPALFPGIRVKMADESVTVVPPADPSPAEEGAEQGEEDEDGDVGNTQDAASFPGIRVKHTDDSVTVVPASEPQSRGGSFVSPRSNKGGSSTSGRRRGLTGGRRGTGSRRRVEKVSKSAESSPFPGIACKETVAEEEHGHVFNASLRRVMAVQARTRPDLDHPYVLDVTMEALRARGAMQTVGIFRVPGVVDDVKLLQDRFEAQQWTIDAHTDVHTIGAVLKLWFRNLAQPLIPPSMYHEALNASRSPQAAVAVVQQLEPLARRVLQILCAFLLELSQHHAVTKMSVSNLALVFAPNIMRPPADTDAMDMMLNSDREKAFLEVLITHLPGASIGLTNADLTVPPLAPTPVPSPSLPPPAHLPPPPSGTVSAPPPSLDPLPSITMHQSVGFPPPLTPPPSLSTAMSASLPPQGMQPMTFPDPPKATGSKPGLWLPPPPPSRPPPRDAPPFMPPPPSRPPPVDAPPQLPVPRSTPSPVPPVRSTPPPSLSTPPPSLSTPPG